MKQTGRSGKLLLHEAIAIETNPKQGQCGCLVSQVCQAHLQHPATLQCSAGPVLVVAEPSHLKLGQELWEVAGILGWLHPAFFDPPPLK